MSEKKVPKKRGRKPKNVIISKKKEQKEELNIPENLIIKLKTSDIETDTILPYEKDTVDTISEEKQCTSEVCWNCCHPFNI